MSTDSTIAVSHGPETTLQTRPLYDYFSSALSDYPDHCWLSEGSNALTYKQADKIVNDIADALTGLGIGKGDRIGLYLPNCMAYPLFSYACWKQGVIVVGLTALYATPMVRTLIEESTPKLVVTLGFADLPQKAVEASEGLADVLVLAPGSNDLISGGESSAEAPAGSMNYADFLAKRSSSQPAAIDHESDLALLQFTGGTTGKPKGTMLAHSCISANLEQLIHYMPEFKFGAEKFIVIGPFTHILGTSLIMGACTALASEIMIPPRFHPEETTQLILDQGITMLAAVPTLVQAIARSEAAQNADWSKLLYCFCGGAPLPPEVADEFKDVTGTKVVQGYGLSETSSGVSFTPPSIDCPDYSVGYPLAGSRVEIRDPSNPENIMQKGEVGEVCMLGPQLMKGYWNRPDATEEVMTQGVFHTGDTGYLDESGALFIVDRIKDIIIASGFNVYPSQVEGAIYKHPAIAEAAVIGAKDDYRGETVKLVAAFKPGQNVDLEALQEFLKDKLSPIEIPRVMDVMDALPKTPVGKIDKKQLS